MRKILALIIGSIYLVGCSGVKMEAPVTPEISIHVKQEKAEENMSQPLPEEMKDPIGDYMEKMTLEEKVGQLFMIAIRKDKEGLPITTMCEEISMLIDAIPVGGVILFSENIVTTQQVMELIGGLQDATTIPLWVGVDEEGGSVSRVTNNPELCQSPFNNALDLGGDTERAYSEAVRMGKILNELGFNMNFAPVADIYNNPENRVIGKRSFGKSAEAVVPMVSAFAKGLATEGIVPVVKHFPGHGNTIEDSHNGLAYVNKTLEMLEQEEIIPFKHAVGEDNVSVMMIGHLVVPEVDPEYPATLSKIWGEYIETHFPEDLLTITDAMEMGAITSYYGSAESAIKVITSGYDMILMPANIQEAYEGVVEACRNGEISEERLDRSVRKILSKKAEHNMEGMHTLINK